MADLEASSAYSNWVRNDYNDRAMSMADDVNQNPETEVPAQEGNEFALAVQKAKAAGMKPGDKFTVGDKEYTLKDAIEQAGLQLETFFNEDSDDYEGSFEYEFTGDDGEMAWGKIHYKAVNGQVDPKSLQGESEYEGNAKVDDEYATYVIQPGGDEHDEALLAAQEDYDEIAMKMQSKFEQPESEGNNELDRIKHLSGIGNEDNAPDMVIRDPDDEADDKDQEIAKDQEEAEKINKELDRIKNLAGLGEEETVKEKDEPADVGLSPQAQDYAEKPDDEDEAEYAEPSQEHYKKALAAGFKGSYEDYKKEYASFPEEFPKNEASKPDFLDMDKDGDKTEPMKKAIKDKEAKEDTDLTAIKKLAGI
jgi:hypothetical protein